MTSEQKFSAFSLAEIDFTSKQSHDNLQTLSELLDEVRRRTGSLATAIQSRLTKRVCELELEKQGYKNERGREKREEASQHQNMPPDSGTTEANILRRQLQ